MKKGKLAIVSTNRSKYSETFIQSHLMNLYDDVLYLYEGYFPKKFSEDKLISEYTISDVKKLLVEKKVTAVLAEYGPSGVEMMHICEELSIPLIVHFHGYDAYRDDILLSYGAHYPEMFGKTDAIVVVSKHMAGQLINLGCDASKVFHIPYGVHTNLFSQYNTDIKIDQIVACGRFVPKKSPQNTIRSFKKVHEKFPETQLVMIGDGELLDECKMLAQELHLGNHVQFTGSLGQNDIARIFAVSKIFVQHSITTQHHDSEGTPLVIMEAGAAGLPVVATRHAGIPDIIEEGVNGFLVPENDIDAMAEKIIFLLSEPNKAEEMGCNLKNKVLDYYTMNRYMNDLRNLINKFSK